MQTVWLSLERSNGSSQTTERTNVPFLPVNSELSATRNQARQKLGRLNNLEFATLLIDILAEAKRRQMGCIPSTISKGSLGGFFREIGNEYVDEGIVFIDFAGSPLSREQQNSTNSDDEPLYDSVPMEDESIYGPQQPPLHSILRHPTKLGTQQVSRVSSSFILYLQLFFMI